MSSGRRYEGVSLYSSQRHLYFDPKSVVSDGVKKVKQLSIPTNKNLAWKVDAFYYFQLDFLESGGLPFLGDQCNQRAELIVRNLPNGTFQF